MTRDRYERSRCRVQCCIDLLSCGGYRSRIIRERRISKLESKRYVIRLVVYDNPINLGRDLRTCKNDEAACAIVGASTPPTTRRRERQLNR